jgi:hypothetical protein
LTSESDRAEACEIRQAWYRLAHGLDKNVADPQVRAVLTDASWSDANFASQLVGIERCMRAAGQRGVNLRYGWAACRDAYDFTPEPVYQYALFSALLGLWIDTEPAQRQPALFERIVVRQTHGWSVNGSRTEPMAFDHPETRCGWIKVPFVWDDLLQLAFEAWLKCVGLEPTTSLGEACTRAAEVDHGSIDWSPAHPYWNGLIGRAIVGKLHPPVPHKLEAGIAQNFCLKIPGLHPFIAHQSPPSSPVDLGNTLAYLAKAFTVSHEAAHILFKRRGIKFATLPEEELAADMAAMGALWNDEIGLGSEVREGQPQDLLWAASGLCFFIGLIVFENLNRSVAAEGSPESDPAAFQASTLIARLRAWSELANTLAERRDGGVDGELTKAMMQVGHLLRSLVVFCNALFDYGRVVAPSALLEANVLWRTLEPDLSSEERW